MKSKIQSPKEQYSNLLIEDVPADTQSQTSQGDGSKTSDESDSLVRELTSGSADKINKGKEVKKT